ncbi:LuxR C-terminal-related transcriptional regulator [Vibrio sp. AND4]|uniref:LuxR C-terminal-related transcriptional regulator n=1 Tax=Vibrio sp. AND4 TaxID=314289 RepID=UPI00015F3062|nr:LuxR C-terminal-related transcriptional regulator [Vibrio sp. AND4]EDP60448.1 putative transcriptional regulator, LuxR family protein [Vibrio sp. AND4]
MEHQNSREVILITEDSLQSSLLKDVLETRLNINVQLIYPENLDTRPKPVSSVDAILLDYSVMSDDLFSRYMEFKETGLKDTTEVLINCDKSITTDELFGWPSLAGIFYTSDGISKLQAGIGKVLQGDMWFSRKFSQQYITHLRRHGRPTSKPLREILTKREQQIITLLSSGASNQQIADQLLVSENTVKTHLHNIFKKIDVKNRVQALIWAKENLPVVSPVI